MYRLNKNIQQCHLQEVKLLLAGVLAADHVLDDGLHCGQDGLVVAEGKHVGDLGVEERVDDGEDLGEDHAGLGQVLVQDPHLRLVRGVLHQGGQHRQYQHLRANK